MPEWDSDLGRGWGGGGEAYKSKIFSIKCQLSDYVFLRCVPRRVIIV